ncbi:tRNA pseudouridine(38-40) synthase TruA [Algisphaera agarilytica]|uniref:tRNA pseudouridine synthase A n=1 Tax=Algisphaera agarilytica TaxID=1385975 RepID=A0A7X0H6A4_9BACT|nr:tRNA pseudouridine(38-40) synthase TruA [Algisphaera agarilytica]MBB6428605.1 tRNA pseudouridine38-40 synthase [Algisphaera agarilytica]
MQTRRYKLTVAYDGSAFHGWQKQQPPDQEWPRTVQGELEAAMMQVLRQPSEVFDLLGASRTDTGVHAVGQVCHFSSDTTIPVERLSRAINSRLPKDIDVRHAEVVHDEFDAIRDATDKQYRYRIYNTRHRPLGIRHLVHHEWADIDVASMQDAARRLIGTHDVEGFAAAAHGRTTTVRTIHNCHVEEHPLSVGSGESTALSNADLPNGAHVTSAGREIHVVISGSGFLYNMVRIVAGTLLDVGMGRMPPERIDEILVTQNRQIAGPTLPPNGLCLEWVKYG